MLVVTEHAQQRIEERHICDTGIARALCSEPLRFNGGAILYYDRRTRTALIVDRADRYLLTVYRFKRREAKKILPTMEQLRT